MTLHIAEIGRGRRPVVFLHGFMGDSHDWLPIAAQLDDARCLLVDLPGHGRSDTLSSGQAFDATVDLLLEQLPAAFTLAGYSLGARLALALAIRAPERVGGLVLESGTAGLTDRAEATARRRLDAERAATLRTTPYQFVFQWSAQPLLLSGRSAPGAPSLEDRRVAHLRERGPEGWAWAVEHLSVGGQPNLWPLLGRLMTSTTVLTGADDDRYTQLGARLVAALSNARQVIATGTGHNIHLERPDIAVDVLRALLADRASASRPLRPVRP
jgi:2-succinyl-6-hydroxy-2,4-cyclohexadiene-1-carboxylate synthase